MVIHKKKECACSKRLKGKAVKDSKKAVKARKNAGKNAGKVLKNAGKEEVKDSGGEKKTEVSQEVPEGLDVVLENGQDNQGLESDTCTGDGVGQVVEEAHEEIANEDESGSSGSSDYSLSTPSYSYYSSGFEPPNQEFIPSEDIAVDEDVSVHKFRKDTDPLEYLERGKYNKPWATNPFLNYIKDGINDRAKRVNAIAKKSGKSVMGGMHAVYHTLYGWIYGRG
ncbi:MAG: hypothetical protein R6U32_07425 [Candidatus Woesearchaeota archaeon]